VSAYGDDLRANVRALNNRELREALTWHQDNAAHYQASGDAAAYQRQLLILSIVREELARRKEGIL
jgi:hypothetical protein